jgi:hypothetical protein
MKLLLGLAFVCVIAFVACSSGETCNAGCLCNSVDSCPSTCFVSQPAGGGAKFCSNAVVTCGNGAWSSSTSGSSNTCGGASLVVTDAGPSGAVCCEAPDAGADQ